MAAQQKRWLTHPTSKLGKIDIVSILRKDDAWILLPQETREMIYLLLPAPREGESPHDLDIHPLNTKYKPYIEEELRRWQADLKDGREGKKWREEAVQAGRDRKAGKFDEEYWGAPSGPVCRTSGEDSKPEHNQQINGDGQALEVPDSEGDVAEADAMSVD